MGRVDISYDGRIYLGDDWNHSSIFSFLLYMFSFFFMMQFSIFIRSTFSCGPCLLMGFSSCGGLCCFFKGILVLGDLRSL